jgi:hypothetical protein
MKYEKPKVNVVKVALNAVQSGEKGTHPAADSAYVTVAAYEADE